jgi:hypothetical protein
MPREKTQRSSPGIRTFNWRGKRLIQCVLLTGSPNVGIYEQAYTRPIFRLLRYHINDRKWDTSSCLVCLVQSSSTRVRNAECRQKRVFILNNHAYRRYGKNERLCLTENFPAPTIPCERIMYGIVRKFLTTCFSAEKKEIY